MNKTHQLEKENAELREEIRRLSVISLAAEFAFDERLKKSETDLLQRERDMQVVLNNIPAMIGYWDNKLLNRFGNYAYLDWFGIDPSKMRGMHIRDVIGDKLYQLNLPYIEAVLRGEAQEFEREIPSVNGSRSRYSLANYIPNIDKGEVLGFFVLVTDITAIKNAEALLKENDERLRASDERYRAVVEDQTELISRFRSDGRFLFANGAYCKFFGKTEAELIDHRWIPVCFPDDLPHVESQLATLSVNNPVVSIENRVYSGRGDIHWMQFVNRGFFDRAGNLVEIQSIGRDISKRKHAETALRDAHELLEQRVIERTQQLRQLVADITMTEERERQALARDLHDGLGQMLHIARVKLDSLKIPVSSAALANIDELRELLIDASRQVRSLTAQLSPPVLKKLGLIAGLRWLCEEMNRQYGLLVEFSHDDEIPALDAIQTEILFRSCRELLVNVAKHSGTLIACLFLTYSDGHLVLMVEDEGYGIDKMVGSPEQLSGFGLASIRERITYLGGSMYVDSDLDCGFRISLSLPQNTFSIRPECQ